MDLYLSIPYWAKMVAMLQEVRWFRILNEDGGCVRDSEMIQNSECKAAQNEGVFFNWLEHSIIYHLWI